MKIQGYDIDISKLTVAEINKLQDAICPGERTIFDDYMRILSRDCRVDGTKERVCKYDPDRNIVLVYDKMKTRIAYATILPIDILSDGIYCTGTSTYELQKDKHSERIVNFLKKKGVLK